MEQFIIALKIIFIGIIEGITEWLPISSTGHMIIIEEFFKLNEYFGQSYFDMFLVVIQFGAILAIIFNFFKELWPFTKTKNKEEKKQIYFLWLNIIIACVPAGLCGLFLDDILNKYLYNFITVAITLIVYGIFFIIVEYYLKKKKSTFKTTDINKLNYKCALIIGISQILALIPGTSRSGITILTALLLGCSREVSMKFSFFISIPIMLAASLFKGYKFFSSANYVSSFEIEMLILGMTVAFLVSFVCIRFLTSFVKKHTFIGFGYYRIALGIILICLYLTLFKNSQNIMQITYSLLNYFSIIISFK